MSVILDALQKARGDNREKPNQPASTARVLEPASVRSGPTIVRKSSSEARPFLFTLLIFSLLLILALVAGAFYFLFARMQQADAKVAATAQQTESLPLTAPASAAGAALIAELPPPVPLHELAIAVAKAPAPTPAAAEATTSKAMQLGSIICDSSDCLASINGRTVRVGDKFRDYQIIEITATTVTMQKPGESPLVISLLD